jgi:hypothetical protein
MSELDKAMDALLAKRTEQDRERRQQHQEACDFLEDFYKTDVMPSRTLQHHGILATFVDGKVLLQNPQYAHYADPLYIVASELGEIDVGGRSLGRHSAEARERLKQELIAEIIGHFHF